MRDWAARQAGAGCYFWAALSSNDSKTWYITSDMSLGSWPTFARADQGRGGGRRRLRSDATLLIAAFFYEINFQNICPLTGGGPHASGKGKSSSKVKTMKMIILWAILNEGQLQEMKYIPHANKSDILGPELMFVEHDKHYPSTSGQTSLTRAVTNFTKPVTKDNFRPST